MKKQIKDILHELQEATAHLSVIRDLYQNDLDYFNENDRRRINDFNETFDLKREQIDGKINSFVKFIEKSFAPTPQELAKEKALQKLKLDFPDFDNWDKNVQVALLERELKNISIETIPVNPKTPVKREKKGESVENPYPEKEYHITSDFSYCKPSALSVSGNLMHVSSWKDVLVKLADFLCSKDVNPLRNYIDSDVSNRPCFSLSTEKYRTPIVVASGIFAEANRSAPDLIKTCRRLLDIYSVDYSDIKIYLSKIASNNV